MVIGIVTEAKDKTRNQFLTRFFKIYSKAWIKNMSNPFDSLVLILPYSKKRLANMSGRRLLKTIEKAVAYMKKCGADKVVVSDFLCGVLTAKSIACEAFGQGKTKKLFLTLAPECVRKTAELIGLDLLNASICISDTKMDRISEYLIRTLCYDTKNLTVITQNTLAAEKFCEAFFDETGLYVGIRETASRLFDVFIDVDEGLIRFGRDIFVRDVDFKYDFDGYKVKSLAAAACLKAVDTSRMICIYEYRKKG